MNTRVPDGFGPIKVGVQADARTQRFPAPPKNQLVGDNTRRNKGATSNCNPMLQTQGGGLLRRLHSVALVPIRARVVSHHMRATRNETGSVLADNQCANGVVWTTFGGGRSGHGVRQAQAHCPRKGNTRAEAAASPSAQPECEHCSHRTGPLHTSRGSALSQFQTFGSVFTSVCCRRTGRTKPFGYSQEPQEASSRRTSD